jgi:hypothetical protein
MTTPKQPGWGLRILKVRNTTGIPEALILPPDHEAPYWADLRQIAQHQARAIYEPITPPSPNDRHTRATRNPPPKPRPDPHSPPSRPDP